MNKLNKPKVQYPPFKAILSFLLLGVVYTINAQERLPFDQGKKYFLGKVNVSGKITYNPQTIITFAGLEKGQEVTIPGEEVTNAVKKLGKIRFV